MAENLNYKTKGSRCYGEDGNATYNENNEKITSYSGRAYCDKYGRLYNWETAKSACPDGWHLPDSSEWEVLIRAVGGEETAGKYLKSTKGWNDVQGGSGNGTDTYSFSSLPGGGCYPNVIFANAGYFGQWWSSSEHDSEKAYYRFMGYDSEKVGLNDRKKYLLSSVRCVRDQ